MWLGGAGSPYTVACQAARLCNPPTFAVQAEISGKSTSASAARTARHATTWRTHPVERRASLARLPVAAVGSFVLSVGYGLVRAQVLFLLRAPASVLVSSSP